MKKSTSFILGLLATITWVTMVVFLAIIYTSLSTGIQGMESTPSGYVGIVILYLIAWIFWGFAVIYVILFAIGIPHFYLYVYDKHHTAFLYLVKYLSVIPLPILIIYGFFMINAYRDLTISWDAWVSYVWPAVWVFPLSILVLLIRHIPYKKRG